MRTALYAGLIVAIGALMLFGLMSKATYEVNVLKDRSPPFVRLSNGDIQNGYALKLVNKSTAARKMSVSITGVDNAELKVVGLESEEMMRFIVPVAAHGVDRYRVLVVVPAASDISTINFVISDLDTGEEITNRVPFQSGER